MRYKKDIADSVGTFCEITNYTPIKHACRFSIQY